MHDEKPIYETTIDFLPFFMLPRTLSFSRQKVPKDRKSPLGDPMSKRLQPMTDKDRKEIPRAPYPVITLH